MKAKRPSPLFYSNKIPIVFSYLGNAVDVCSPGRALQRRPWVRDGQKIKQFFIALRTHASTHTLTDFQNTHLFSEGRNGCLN